MDAQNRELVMGIWISCSYFRAGKELMKVIFFKKNTFCLINKHRRKIFVVEAYCGIPGVLALSRSMIFHIVSPQVALSKQRGQYLTTSILVWESSVPHFSIGRLGRDRRRSLHCKSSKWREEDRRAARRQQRLFSSLMFCAGYKFQLTA